MQPSESRRHYWRKNLAVITVLMAIWFVVTFVAVSYTHLDVYKRQVYSVAFRLSR